VWASAPAAVALRKEAHVKRCLHELNHSQNITSRLITNLMTLLQDTVTTESDSSGIINRFAATYLSSIFVVPILPWLMVRRAASLASALTCLWTGHCQAGQGVPAARWLGLTLRARRRSGVCGNRAGMARCSRRW
jgi:hypothetical protein